jgi:hypothetical protein
MELPNSFFRVYVRATHPPLFQTGTVCSVPEQFRMRRTPLKYFIFVRSLLRR